MGKKKRRSKKNGPTAKQVRAAEFNTKKRKMHEFAKIAGIEKAYSLIPKLEVDILLAIGLKPLTVLPADGEKIPNIYLQAIKKVINSWTKGLKLNVTDCSSVSFYDYYFVGEMLTYLLSSEGLDYKNKDRVARAAASYLEKVKNGFLPYQQMKLLAQHLSESICAPDFGYMLLEFGTYKTKGILAFCYHCFYLKIVDRQELKVFINNKKRTVYRLGIPLADNKMTWVKVAPEKLGVDCCIANLEIDVYIQKHALMRLRERLNGFSRRFINLLLYSSAHQFKTIKNSQGQSLLQLNFGDKKLGYLVYRYVEGVVVITTFLLVTNNGTPEGEKLHNMLGVEKIDKQYLGIDKIETFICSDLKHDKRAVEIFTKAGCGDLFQLPSEILNQDIHETEVVDVFVKYLELDNEGNDEEVNYSLLNCEV